MSEKCVARNSLGLWYETVHRYACDDMSYHGVWDREQSEGELQLQWQDVQYRPQARRSSHTHTAPVTNRERMERSDNYGRPASSGEGMVVAHRPRRSDPYPQHPQPNDCDSNSQWPPRGYTKDSVLDTREAEHLISTGANTFKGYIDEIPNVPEHFRFYAVMESEHYNRTDRAEFQHEAFKDISLALAGPSDAAFPWVSLEQPCMAYCFGKMPGTTTLNYWVSKSGCTQLPVQCGAKVRPKKIKLLQILDRLCHLQNGIDDDLKTLYTYLYSTLIDDPDKRSSPHYGMESQIADLITVLGHTDWIDFSLPKNQVVAKFFETQDTNRKQQFFHQLLLSVELHLRVQSEGHTDKAKRKLLLQLPPKIAWDLAVAQRWLENMSISREQTSSNKSTFSFDLQSKKRQKDALRLFASTLKWPNINELSYVLDERDRKEKAVEDRSADAMSWFTGVVLPGPTLPWLVMNSVIDCDRDTGDSLKYLTHMHQQSGFQYRANTYWSYECVVGKVLGAARGVTQIAGWIGPCNYTPDLKRTECVRIKQLDAPDLRLTRADVEQMAYRTEPLGPQDDGYPVDDYELVIPDTDDVTDAIRVEKLSFQLVKDQPISSRMGAGAPLLFDSAIIFACGGESWPMHLKYNVSFIAAYPCSKGPHVLFYDYAYRAIKVDAGLVDINNWAEQARGETSQIHQLPRISSNDQPIHSGIEISTHVSGSPAHCSINQVLTIEAFGVSDNEVFARAWCAQWGHSALVANIKETCMACAIREAYAACVSVVILTEGGRIGEKDEDV